MVHFCRSSWISQLFISFSLAVFLAPVHANNVIYPEDFVNELFKKYGNNISLDSKQLKTMLKNLGIGMDNEKTPSDQASVKDRCFSASSVLDVFSFNESSLLTKQDFNTICPAVVQQIDSQKCSDETEELEATLVKESKAKAWGYGFLAVFIISCASLFGAFVVPFMSREFYKKLLLFLVSLAVGVLGGSGIFHLIPSAFEAKKEGDFSYLYKGCVVVGGIYFFFSMEYIMKMYVRFKDDTMQPSGHGHSISLSNDKKHQHEIPDNGIAEAQLAMYNIKQDHHQGHTESFCIGNKYFPKTPGSVVPSADSQDSQKKRIAPVAWMIICGDGMHNFIDGLAIGAGFSTSVFDGLSTSLAIFCEELPHELGDFAVLLNAGLSYKQALLCNFLSACLCFVGLVIGLLLGYSTTAVKWIKALAGGMFLYISLVDMLQEATEMSCKEGQASIRQNLKTFALQSFGILFGFAVMLILAIYGHNISI